MLKPEMPKIPGMGAMTDTLGFVKNLWGSMGIPGMSGMPGMSSINLPGMVVPTLSVEEIRKKITDLKAVEAWLEMNMNMLRGTIQGLEVQAATISTLQSMGEALSATVKAGANKKSAFADGSATATSAKGTQKASSSSEPTDKDEVDAASLTAPLVNAAAWWNLMQEQFKQAVGSAMAPEAPLQKPDVAQSKAEIKAKPPTTPVTTSASASLPARKRKPAK